jgi:hypothetical protein
MNSEITVTDITESTAISEPSKKVDLRGGPELNEIADRLMRMRRLHAKKVFHLKWKGGKVPEGAVVDEKRIVYTRDGNVTGERTSIGTYERLVEFGGENRDEHQMLVFM